VERADYLVVGAGIVGLATARELSRRHPQATTVVVEKEGAVGLHQTGHNSGVVHAGLYYPPGSLKARLCGDGRERLRAFCAEEAVPYVECGKLVVAVDDGELDRLAHIESRARANGVPGLRRLDGAGLRAVEPNAAGVAALHSPRTAITDFAQVAAAMARPLDVRTGFEVVALSAAGGRVTARSSEDALVEADHVVLCAGLHSDVLARRAGAVGGPLTVPFRGEYWRLVEGRAGLVRGLIYPVPDPRYPFLGVHFTRRVDGRVDLGPNAVLGLAREGYRRGNLDLRWLASMATSGPVWRMARSHWRAGAHELAGSLSKRVFVARAARLVPALRSADVVRAPAGVRAQAVDPDGTLVDDFRLVRLGRGGRILAVQNAPSPAATSSLAIAGHICDTLDNRP
jgi:L-2-hydroxyglutarate oxidase LhgO